MPRTQTLALVGAAGGVGTTRLAVECGATLARTGRDVAVVDAAFDTQGLARYVEGRIEADVTTLATGDAELGTALYERELDVPGRLALCPARAPFERLARAKTAAAARRFEQQLAAAALSHDAVIVDTPPSGATRRSRPSTPPTGWPSSRAATTAAPTPSRASGIDSRMSARVTTRRSRPPATARSPTPTRPSRPSLPRPAGVPPAFRRMRPLLRPLRLRSRPPSASSWISSSPRAGACAGSSTAGSRTMRL